VFDLRYHVASLAAVFFALVIGILVGVALASHGLGSAERNKLEDELRNADNTIQGLRGTAQEYRADSSFVSTAYGAVMTNRLRGRRVAVLFIGRVDAPVREAIRRTLDDSGATTIRMRAISVPINAHAVEAALAKRSALAAFTVGPKRFVNLGRELGNEFVAGGATPAWDALEDQLVEERSGGRRPADAVVVVRTAPPQLGRATAQVLGSLYGSLADGRAPAVGAELRGTFPSAVQTYKNYGLSSVDDLDLPIGRVALAVLLSSDTVNGHYGLQQGIDDGILPQIPAVTPTTATGG
jgi:hypothetical protein